MTAPSWADMLRVFGRIGLLSFGGPAAQIAVMQRELVERTAWLDDETFVRALSLCMLLPGPEAMQLATYAGWRLRGIPGGLLGGALFVLPGAAVIGLLVGLYLAFGTLPLVAAAFLGIKATVVIIVLQAMIRLSGKVGTDGWGRIIAALAFLGIFVFDVPFPAIVLGAGLAGAFLIPAKPVAAQTSGKPPDHRAVWTRAFLWAVVWLAPLAVLTNGGGLLGEIGWFYAWLAVVSFGGAYALLGYMTQTLVQDYGWITTPQMIDALGLAETTPGPLILVTQFVAMLAGYGTGGAALAIAAGFVALWATFVPCFLWIFTAAPYLDAITARPRLQSALGAITAAVLGVILSLSVWFAFNVLFATVGTWSSGPLSVPWPTFSSLDVKALALVAVAAALLLWRKMGLGLVLPTMAALGTALGLL